MEKSFITDFEQPVSNIRKEFKDKLERDKLQAVVLGMSGGIDSLACAVLALPVCVELKIPLIAHSISIESNKPEEISRARKNGTAFCTEFMEYDLTALYQQNVAAIACRDRSILGDCLAAKIRRGNIKARMRMISLFDTAAARKGFVLSTDNFTELLLGFWTLNGDVGNYGMIQNLWKTEVFDMMDYFKELYSNNLAYVAEGSLWPPVIAAEIIEETISADCTDGLNISNTDLDQIMPEWRKDFSTVREGYKAVDLILKNPDKSLNHSKSVLSMRDKTQFKREDPYNIPRDIIISN